MPRVLQVPRSSEPDPDDPVACERAAVALLARREHSRLELERKLAARGFAGDVAAATLDELERTGLLDGRRFIASFVASRAARGTGPVRIRADLVQRGVAPADAATALRDAREEWGDLAREVRRKRFGAAVPKDFRERARQARFLQYRGFEAAQVQAALDLDADSD